MNPVTGPRLLLAAVLAYFLLAGYPVLQEAWTIPEAQAASPYVQNKILAAIQNSNDLLDSILFELQSIKAVLKNK